MIDIFYYYKLQVRVFIFYKRTSKLRRINFHLIPLQRLSVNIFLGVFDLITSYNGTNGVQIKRTHTDRNSEIAKLRSCMYPLRPSS